MFRPPSTLGGTRRLGRLRMRAGARIHRSVPHRFQAGGAKRRRGGAWQTVVSETGIVGASDWQGMGAGRRAGR